jgi:hypothetical protein
LWTFVSHLKCDTCKDIIEEVLHVRSLIKIHEKNWKKDTLKMFFFPMKSQNGFTWCPPSPMFMPTNVDYMTNILNTTHLFLNPTTLNSWLLCPRLLGLLFPFQLKKKLKKKSNYIFPMLTSNFWVKPSQTINSTKIEHSTTKNNNFPPFRQSNGLKQTVNGSRDRHMPFYMRAC